MKALLLKLSTIVLLCFTIGAQAADQKSSSSLEAKRAIAIKQIDDFGQRMTALDPSYSSKSTRITAAASIITKNYSPDQWLERVQFLYAALSEIDAKSATNDPDLQISKYFQDELSRAPANIAQQQGKNRQSYIDARTDELEFALQNGSISMTEHAARMTNLIIVASPNDKALIDTRRYKLELALKMDRGEISKQQLDDLWAIKRHEHNAAAKRKNDIQNQQQQYMVEQAEAQQRAESSQRWANVLTGAAKGMQNAANQQRDRTPVTCTAVANIMTCR